MGTEIEASSIQTLERLLMNHQSQMHWGTCWFFPGSAVNTTNYFNIMLDGLS